MSEQGITPAENQPPPQVDGAAGQKKKKREVVTPPCPPAVATAYLVLRGAVEAVVGANMLETNASIMQPTYIKEKPVLSGKFSISVGKKLGFCQLELPEDNGTEKEAILQAIQTAANRIISTDHKQIDCYQATKEQVQNGPVGKSVGPPLGIFNQSHGKTKANQDILVAAMEGWVVAVPPGIPFASTSSLETIIVELDTTLNNNNQASDITCGKKSRKDATITIKFQTTVAKGAQDAPMAKVTTSEPSSVMCNTVEDLSVNRIRCPEGNALLQLQQESQQQQKAAAAAAAAAAAESKSKGETAAAAAAAAADSTSNEMVVTAWDVSGKIDYTKLVDNFGSQLLTPPILAQLEQETVGKGRVPNLHRFLRRNIFFSHRDLHTLLTHIQKGIPMYLYTGRGPSSGSMHLGHLIPFLFTKWLQQAFDCPLVIQMTDDEKFLFKGNYDEHEGDNLNYFANLTIENARDIIACGFKYEKTFVFSDLDYVGRMYPNIVRIWKAVTTNTVNGIFGFDGSSNIGKVAFPAIQAAPSFASSFPTVLQADMTSPQMCLIPCAIDQDPYFRMTRDVAHKMVRKPKTTKDDATTTTSAGSGKPHALGGKPSLIHSKFFPPLQGAEGKMSSSDTNSAIFLTDSPEDIERKIKTHAFSGGRETKAEQQELGANLEIDVSFQWLKFFLEDDELLAKIEQDYGTGSGEYWSTGKVKQKLIEVLQELVAEHQERRAKITDDEVRKWMAERSLVG